MARPLRGSITELDGGRVRASLPVARGAKKRTAPVFAHRREAEEWLNDGVAELQAGRSLPDPDAYRRRREPVSQPPLLRTVRQAVHHWHRETFDSLQAAQPKRRRQVLDDLTNHLLPVLDQLGITELDAVSREVIVDFGRSSVAGRCSTTPRVAPTTVGWHAAPPAASSAPSPASWTPWSPGSACLPTRPLACAHCSPTVAPAPR